MSEPSFTKGRKWQVGFSVTVALASAFALVVMANFLSSRHSVRVNWSESAGNKLSPMTLRVLKTLSASTNKVKVIVFFSRNELTMFGAVTSLLKDYQMASDRLEVEIVDYRFPGRSEAIRAKYQLSGGGAEGSRVIFDCNGRVRAVMSGELSEFSLGPNKEIRRSAFKGEQLFTSAILSVTSAEQVKAYFLTGHNEHSPDSQDDSSGYYNFRRQLLDADVNLGMIDSLQYRDIPEDCSLLIIPGPATRFAPIELERIDAYLKKGGRLLALFLPHESKRPPTGLEALLANWNVEIGMNVVQDQANQKPGEVLVARQFGIHAVTRAMMRSSLDFVLPRSVASLRAARADAPKTTELVFTSAQGIAGRVNERAEKVGAIPLAVAVEKGGIQGVSADRGATRIVVVGSSLSFGNVALGMAGNADFANLAVNWLLNRDVLLTEIAPRAIREYTLNITDQQMTTLRWIFLGAAPTAALAIGGFVWVRRRK